MSLRIDDPTRLDAVAESQKVTPLSWRAPWSFVGPHWLLDWFREFPWLTRRRLFFYSGVVLLAYVAASIAQLATSHHLIAPSGAPIVGDFVNQYAASIFAIHGHPALVYNLHRQHLQQISVLRGASTDLWAFEYPPMYLLMVLPLSLLPLAWSWVMFETVTLAGYVAVIRRVAPRAGALWLAIAFPAVIINFMCGQNGFVTTALMGGGLLLMESRPILAGTLFGLMVYKPQFAVLVPLALLVDRRWRVLIATGLSAVLFVAASLAIFGEPTWRAFIGSIPFTQKTVLDNGALGFYQLLSIFGAIRMWGGGLKMAYAFQAALAMYAAIAVIWVWRSDQPFALKAATLAAGSLMVSPYLLQYDLVLLALPIAWTAMEALEHGFLPFEKFVLSLAWFVPRIALSAGEIAKIPVAPIAIVALMTMILRRASQAAPDARLEQRLESASEPLPAPGW